MKQAAFEHFAQTQTTAQSAMMQMLDDERQPIAALLGYDIDDGLGKIDVAHGPPKRQLRRSDARIAADIGCACGVQVNITELGTMRAGGIVDDHRIVRGHPVPLDGTDTHDVITAPGQFLGSRYHPLNVEIPVIVVRPVAAEFFRKVRGYAIVHADPSRVGRHAERLEQFLALALLPRAKREKRSRSGELAVLQTLSRQLDGMFGRTGNSSKTEFEQFGQPTEIEEAEGPLPHKPQMAVACRTRTADDVEDALDARSIPLAEKGFDIGAEMSDPFTAQRADANQT